MKPQHAASVDDVEYLQINCSRISDRQAFWIRRLSEACDGVWEVYSETANVIPRNGFVLAATNFQDAIAETLSRLGHCFEEVS